MDTDKPGQALSAPHAGNQSQLDLRKSDFGIFVIRNDAVVTGKCQFCAPAHTGSMDAGNNRLGEFFDSQQDFMADSAQFFKLFGFLSFFKHLNISAGNKIILFTADKNSTAQVIV